MSHKETLKAYNARLDDNNITLDSVLETINNLPEAGGGETPEKGFIVKACNETGYATEVEIIGMNTIPDYAFCVTDTTYSTMLTKYLEKIKMSNTITSINMQSFRGCQILKTVELSDNITTIGVMAFYNCKNLALKKLPNSLISMGNQCFYDCQNLELTELPSNLTLIDQLTFYNCKKLNIKTLPDSLTTIKDRGFGNCTGISQISMNKVSSIQGNSSAYSPFANCTNLKGIWIGSVITSSGFSRYSFGNCTGIKKMFIDLPRATVEGFTGYSYAFSNNAVTTSVIVCNDDEGWMTKEEFDAIDWATYSE